MIAVLTGDLIASTRMTDRQRESALAVLEQTAAQISLWDRPTHFTRTRGDGWQMVTAAPLWLRASLAMMAALRAADLGATRIAVATGDDPYPDTPDLNRVTGPTFVASGRLLDQSGDRLSYATSPEGAAVAALAGHIAAGWTAKQAQSLTLALPPDAPTHADIAASLGISRQAVDQSLRGAGWPALGTALSQIEAQAGLPAKP